MNTNVSSYPYPLCKPRRHRQPATLLLAALIILWSLFFSLNPVQAQTTINVCSHNATSTYNILGSNAGSLRAKLDNPANFGPSGAYGDFDFAYIDVGDNFTEQTILDNACNIWFSGFEPDESYTPTELTELQNWVNNNNGQVIAGCDGTSHDPVCDLLNFTVTTDTDTYGFISTAAVNVINCDGNLGPGDQLNMAGGVGGYFSGAGVTAENVLAVHETEGAADATKPIVIYTGQYFLTADINMIQTGGTTDVTLSDGPNVTNNNDILTMNAFSALADVSVGNDVCSSADDSDQDGVEAEIDNCPDVANPGQEDSDNDGEGDACDADDDNDGVDDTDDPAPFDPNEPADSGGNACTINVAEATGYSLVYRLQIPENSDYKDGSVSYTTDSTATIGDYERVAYCMQLDEQWVWVSMDDFTSGTIAHTGVPVASVNPDGFQQTVTNMNVHSNVDGVVTGDDITTGNIEFWSNSYVPQNQSGISGASDDTYDFGDSTSTSRYGSMQIHNYGASQTISAYNAWDHTFVDELGIGNSSTDHPDWTFSASASSIANRNLWVYVMEVIATPTPTNTPEPTSTPTATPTNTPEPTSTPTATPTNTPEPTNAPTATPTNTPTPTATPFELANELQPSLDPPSLEFVWVKGRANPPSQKMIVRNPGGVGWESGGWINNPSGDYAAGGYHMNVSVNPRGENLDVGVHEDELKVVARNKTPDEVPLFLDVKLTVGDAQGKLEVNRQSLNFGGFLGEPVESQIVDLIHTGIGTSDWTASGPPWLTLSPTSGKVSLTEPNTLTVGIDTAAINQADTYAGKLTVTDGSTTHEIDLRLIQLPEGAPRIELFGLEVTQGVQSLLNDVPFVAKRPTFVRAHVRSLTGTSIGKVTASLSGTTGDGTQLKSLSPINAGGSISVTVVPDRAKLHESFLFELPEEWRMDTVTLQFEGKSQPIACVDPAEESMENGVANDCTVTLSYEEVPVFPITYIRHNDYGQIRTPRVIPHAFSAEREHASKISDQLLAGLPIPDVDEHIHETVSHLGQSGSIRFGTGPRGIFKEVDLINWKNKSTAILQNVETMHKAGSQKRHYYGLVARYPVIRDGKDIFYNTGGAGVASVGGFTGAGYLTEYEPMFTLNMHEIGHNLNRLHVNCGLPKPPPPPPPPATPPKYFDDNFPEGQNEQISKALAGNEAYFGFNIVDKQTIYPPKLKDYMGYCEPDWISPYTYKAMIANLKTRYMTSTVQASAVETIALTNDPILLVSGRITGTVAGTIENIFDNNASAAISAATEPSDYSLRLEDAGGQTLATYPVSPEAIDVHDAPRYLYYTLAIPRPANLARVVLLHQTQVLAEGKASANAPTITLITPAGGEALDDQSLSITWSASDADGDTLSFNVDYSTDDGTSWNRLASNWIETTLAVDSADLPGATQARIRVSANDGFLTTFARSAPFAVADHLPVANIASTNLNRYYVGGQLISLQGRGYDVEDGAVSDLTWHSDRDGVLGTGPTLLIDADDLAEGPHLIRLEAKDSQGQSSFSNTTVSRADAGTPNDFVTFEVLYDPQTLPAELAITADLGFYTTAGSTQPATQMVELSNLGDGALGWTARSDADYVTLESSGSTPAMVAVTVDPSGLADGFYRGALTFTPTVASLSPVQVDYFINVGVAPVYGLTVNKVGSGSGTVTSTPAGIDCGDSCGLSFAADTTVTLSAVANNGMTFNGWSGSGGCSGSADSCQVTLDQARSVTATFVSAQATGGQNGVYLPIIQN